MSSEQISAPCSQREISCFLNVWVQIDFGSGSKFFYQSEVVETRLENQYTVGDFEIQLITDPNYLLSVSSHHELAPGKKDVVLARRTDNSANERWWLNDGKIESLAAPGYFLSLYYGLENERVVAEKEHLFVKTGRTFLWRYDYENFWNLGIAKILTINIDDDGDIDQAVGKTAIVKNGPIKYKFKPQWPDTHGPPKYKTTSYIQNVNIYHRTGTMQKFLGPDLDQWKRSDYEMNEKTTWDTHDSTSCFSEVILPSDTDFGYILQKNSADKEEVFPLTPDGYFKYGEQFNTTWIDKDFYDHYETCYEEPF